MAVNQYTNNINPKEAALAGQPAEGSYQSLEERVSWGILGYLSVQVTCSCILLVVWGNISTGIWLVTVKHIWNACLMMLPVATSFEYSM